MVDNRANRPSFLTAVNFTITDTISLSPDVDDLNVFVAAAGYADAAVIYALPDPPYVSDTWSIAGFTVSLGSVSCCKTFMNFAKVASCTDAKWDICF